MPKDSMETFTLLSLSPRMQEKLDPRSDNVYIHIFRHINSKKKSHKESFMDMASLLLAMECQDH